MLATFRRLGLQFDEGPGIGGAVGPYIQSERLPIYRKHADVLVGSGHAYHCFCTPDRLDLVRKVRAKEGLPSAYDGHCLSLDDAEVAKRLDDMVPHVIRMRPPSEGVTEFNDLVRGRVVIENKYIDHQVAIKSDGFPTYHLASVVDDHLMKITHVVRGEEWLASTPKHLVLYDAFQWDRPTFAHLPLLLNSAREKLSKRHQHSSVEHLLESGYLSSAILHFAVTMGWNPSADQSIDGPMTLDDVIQAFEVNRIQKGGAQVDIQRLKWLSGLHFRTELARNPDSVAAMVRAYSPEAMRDISDSFLRRVISVVADRVCVLGDVVRFGSGLLKDPELDIHELKRHCLSQPLIDELTSKLLKPDARIDSEIMQTHLPVLRYILTGDLSGPPISSILYALGHSRTSRRIQAASRLLLQPLLQQCS